MESSHLTALEARHKGLETALRQELARPLPDDAKIQLLKKRKLQIKQAIALD